MERSTNNALIVHNNYRCMHTLGSDIACALYALCTSGGATATAVIFLTAVFGANQLSSGNGPYLLRTRSPSMSNSHNNADSERMDKQQTDSFVGVSTCTCPAVAGMCRPATRAG